MGPTAARVAALAGVLVVLVTLASWFGGPSDALVAGGGLLVSAGAAAVGFASAGTDRRTALLGALLGLVPAVVLAGRLAADDLTGGIEREDNEQGLADARRRLCAGDDGRAPARGVDLRSLHGPTRQRG